MRLGWRNLAANWVAGSYAILFYTQREKIMKKGQSLQAAVEKMSTVAGENVAKALEGVGDGRTNVIVVVPVVFTGTIVLNREMEWSGDEN